MTRRGKSILGLLILAPWWVSILVGAAAFIGLKFLLPAQMASSEAFGAFATTLQQYAPFVAFFFFFFGGLSYFQRQRSRKLVDGQRDLETLKQLTWKEFEWMVAEAYRRQGYSVEESFGGGSDGGVDLTLHKGNRTVLVQCKRWKSTSVGAPVIREMYGILTDKQVDEIIVVASGRFTKEAVQFAKGKPIQLIDGLSLLKLLSDIQSGKSSEPIIDNSPTGQRAVTPVCPNCGSDMVQRVAKKGKNAGTHFWGCSQFPRCNGTVPG